MRPKLLLATNNAGKVREFRSLLAGIPFDLVTPKELGITMAVEETGATYRENARLKACVLAAQNGFLTLADDSGLEVAALHGAPGVLSARYAGENASNDERIAYLLSKLKDVPPEKRSSRFYCVIAIAKPDGTVQFCDGECRERLPLNHPVQRVSATTRLFIFLSSVKQWRKYPPVSKIKSVTAPSPLKKQKSCS